MLYMMYTCFSNKEIMTDHNPPTPQELVQNNEWTYAKFFEMCKGVYALPIDCRDPEMCAAVLECFAFEGYRCVTPALFEITLKVKYADDTVLAEMYDLIRENVTFDIGRIFSSQLIPQSDFRNALANNQNTWVSVAKVRGKMLESKLKILQKAFE